MTGFQLGYSDVGSNCFANYATSTFHYVLTLPTRVPVFMVLVKSRCMRLFCRFRMGIIQAMAKTWTITYTCFDLPPLTVLNIKPDVLKA